MKFIRVSEAKGPTCRSPKRRMRACRHIPGLSELSERLPNLHRIFPRGNCPEERFPNVAEWRRPRVTRSMAATEQDQWGTVRCWFSYILPALAVPSGQICFL